MRVFTALFFVCWVTSAYAQTQKGGDLETQCGAPEPQDRIAPCTELLESGDYTDYQRAAILTIRGGAYLQLDRYEEALSDLDSAIRLDPGLPQAFLTRGGVYALMDDMDRALRDFDEAVRLDPFNPFVFSSRGNAYYAIGKPHLGVHDFNEALRLDPHHDAALLGRASANESLGYFDRAMDDYETMLELYPDSPAVMTIVAEVLATKPELHDEHRAVDLARRALQIRESAFSRQVLASGLVLQGHLEEAVLEYEAAARLSPGIAQSFQRWLKANGYYSGAIDGVWGPGMRAAIEECVRAGCQVGVDVVVHDPDSAIPDIPDFDD